MTDQLHSNTPDTEKAEANTQAAKCARILQANALASRGEYDKAEALLLDGRDLPASEEELDVLARLALHTGRLRRATHLWRLVAQKNPHHEAARLANRWLTPPWLFLAFGRRLLQLAAFALLCAFAVAGAYYAISYRQGPPPSVSTHYRVQQGPPRHSSLPLAPVPISPPVPQGSVQEQIASSETTPAESPPASLPLLLLNAIDGCTIHTNGNEARIVFDAGLFSYRCEFTQDAREQIANVAQTLLHNADRCWIVVEGHTDSDPLPPNSPYRDNYTLGLQRALAVAATLVTDCHLPRDAVQATSAGEWAPPCSGNDYETKLRNRTAVLRLVRRDTEPKPDGQTANESPP